jgi:hypothetical protein
MLVLFTAIINVIITLIVLLLPYGLIGYGLFGVTNPWLGALVTTIGFISIAMLRPITNIIKAWKETNKEFFGK